MKKVGFYLLVLSFLACKKTPSVNCDNRTNDVTISEQIIVGKWEWASQQTCGRAGCGSISTPTTQGFTKQMVFKADGNVYIYKNNALEKEGHWRIAPEKEFTNATGPNLLVLETTDKKPFDLSVFHICSDSLYLNVGYDGTDKWAKQ